MRAVIFSDTHLGKVQFGHQTYGRNTRERDVEAAFKAAIQKIVELQPDLVLVPGDIVDHIRVSMFAVRVWRNGLRRISEETEAQVVVAAGNHDMPRISSTLSPIIIPDDLPRVHIATEPQRLRLQLNDGTIASIDCFPFVTRKEGEEFELEPDAEADHRVLLIHAAVRTSNLEADQLPKFYAGDTAIDIGYEAERYDVVAVGDFHTFRRLHPTRLACYPGSLERTSSNIWDEPEEKGMVLVDTATQSLEFIALPTRKMIDLPPLYGASAEDVNLRLEAFAADDELKDAIVRWKVEEFPKSERLHIDRDLVPVVRQEA